MRLLGLDYGAHTVGVALSDETGLIATRLEVIRREKENHLRRTFARIEALIAEYGAEAVVLGLPLHMDGRTGVRAEKTLQFREQLQRRTGLEVHLQDERLSSVEAEEILRAQGVKPSDIREQIDAVAAEVILQDYLNARET